MVIRHPQIQMAPLIVDMLLECIAEPENGCKRHEGVVPVCTSFDFPAAVFGPRRVGVNGAVLRNFVGGSFAASSLERTRKLPRFFAAVTARYVLQFTVMKADVLLNGTDQFLLREWSCRRDGIEPQMLDT